jgi:hypothetical protein
MTRAEVEDLLQSEAVKALITDVAAKAAQTAVKETLTKLGVDHDDPLEMQADFRWVRDFRKTSAEMRNKSLLALIGILVTGSAAAFWLGLKSQILGALIK